MHVHFLGSKVSLDNIVQFAMHVPQAGLLAKQLLQGHIDRPRGLPRHLTNRGFAVL